MKKHLSESLIAVACTLVFSAIGITATQASINSSHDVVQSQPTSAIAQVPSGTVLGGMSKVTADGNIDVSFAEASITSTPNQSVTASAKTKIGFASVSVKSIPKPKPKPIIVPPVSPPSVANTTTSSPNDTAPSSPAVAPLPQNMSGYQQYAGRELSRRGTGANQLACLIPLWNKESSWDPNAANPSSSARGIPQMMMGIHYGLDWATNAKGREYLSNPEVQINVGLDYIQERYHDPCNALNIWNTQSWY